MNSSFEEQSEKKVEYLELIYDLIFVYLVGRNNSLLHALENGFVPAGRFLTYILCTLIVILIWSLTTLFINRDLETNGTASIAVSVVFIYSVLLHLYLSWKKQAPAGR